jgi:Cu/Ag efflux protein CusF
MLRIINGYPFAVIVNFTTNSIHLLTFNESWKDYDLGIKINRGSQTVKIIDLENNKILLIHSYIENSNRGVQELYYVYPDSKIEFLTRVPGILIHLPQTNYTFGDMLYLPSSFINARLSSIYTLSQEKYANLWIKVPYIPASSNTNTTIYLYYGNLTTVTSASDGKSVFEDFDDFPQDTLHSYIQIDEGWSINITLDISFLLRVVEDFSSNLTLFLEVMPSELRYILITLM